MTTEALPLSCRPNPDQLAELAPYLSTRYTFTRMRLGARLGRCYRCWQRTNYAGLVPHDPYDYSPCSQRARLARVMHTPWTMGNVSTLINVLHCSAIPVPVELTNLNTLSIKMVVEEHREWRASLGR